MKRILYFLLAIMLVFVSTDIFAQVPREFTYQGKLLGNGEQPVPEGHYKITFSLYNEQGTSLWSETHDHVFIAGGIFQVNLGSVNGMPLPFNEPYYLGIKIGTDPELTPRMLLTTSPYSFRAEDANHVGGFRVSNAAEPHVLFPLGNDGKFPASVLPAGAPSGNYLKKGEPDTSNGTSNHSMLLISNIGSGDGIEARGGNGRGLLGSSDYNDGIVGKTGKNNKSGVYGHSIDGFGVTGSSTNNIGVQGFGATGVKGRSTIDNGKGVFGEASGGSGTGVYGAAKGSSSLYGVYGSCEYRWQRAVYSKGDLEVDGSIYASDSKSGFVVDICLNDDGTSLKHGEVVVISGVAEPVLGTIPVPLVCRATGANATGIIGVVDRLYQTYSNSVHHPKMQGSTISEKEPNGSLMEGMTIAPGSYLSVVTLGAYQVIRIDASYGAIQPGDLLTSSPSPGYAMKAQPVNVSGVEFYRPGTIIGRALATLEFGQGTVPVFVSLQ
jgi:hypothetical protein